MAMESEIKTYTRNEEIANIATHAFGLICALIAGTLMVFDALSTKEPVRIAGSALFASGLIALYLSSTLYHSCTVPTRRRLYRLADHMSIFVLIAGTYSPFLLVGLGNKTGWWLFFAIWALAVLGIVFKLKFGTRYPRISLALYLGMGWIAVFGFSEFYNMLDFKSLLLLAAGGLAYTVGTIFYRWHSLSYHHAIWHLFVLAGSTLHFLAVQRVVFPNG